MSILILSFNTTAHVHPRPVIGGLQPFWYFIHLRAAVCTALNTPSISISDGEI